MRGTCIFTGRDALTAVASPDGHWNWALVGPDPECLPLAGGGSGSIDQMRGCLQKTGSAVLCGLLRLDFGTGRFKRSKYVFLNTNIENLEEVSTAVARGKAIGKLPAMHKALAQFVKYTVQIEITQMEDINVTSIIDRVRKVSTVDEEDISAELFYAALAEFRSKLPPEEVETEMTEVEQEAASAEAPPAIDVPEEVEVEEVPRVEAEVKLEEIPRVETEVAAAASRVAGGYANVSSVPDATRSGNRSVDVPENPPPMVAPSDCWDPLLPELKPMPVSDSQAPPKPPFAKGDLVEVFSNADKKWCDDGVIEEIANEAGTYDGVDVPAGAIKVKYGNNRKIKWISREFLEFVKLSTRPVPPSPLVGEMMKQTHNWLSEWHPRYFQLNQGWMQWWKTAQDARKGMEPNGRLHLLGLELNSSNSTAFQLRTSDSKGVVYAFDAVKVDAATRWIRGLEEHYLYAKNMHRHKLNQSGH